MTEIEVFGVLVPEVGEKTERWQFLNICEPSQTRNGEFRRCVKKNAMGAYQRQERVQRVQAFERAKRAMSGAEEVPPPAKGHPAASAKGFAAGKFRLSDNAFNTSTKRDFSRRSRKSGPGASAAPAVSHAPQRIPHGGHGRDAAVLYQSTPSDCMDYDVSNQSSTDSDLVCSPQSLLGAGRVDPFGTCPSDGQTNYYQLVDHFIATFAPAFLPIDRSLDQNPVNRLWTRHSLSSAVLSNAILSCAAVHLDTLYGRQGSMEAFHYRGETIRLLNECLSSSDQIITESAIAAVGILAANENMTENIKELRVHMNALEKMVKLTGGLRRLGWNGTLAMFISWQDLIASVKLCAKPRFTYVEYPVTEIVPGSFIDETEASNKLCCSVPSIASDISDFAVSTGPHGDIPAILHEIRYLTLVVESFKRTRGATPVEMLAFSKSRSALEYRLLSVPVTLKSAARTDHYIYEACRFAALIYINYVLHEFDPVFGVLGSLKGKLMETLSWGEASVEIMKGMGQSASSLLLWVLFMGGLLASGDVEREWFAERIARTMERLSLTSWLEVEGFLMRALWVRSLRDSACETLWFEVQGQMDVVDMRESA